MTACLTAAVAYALGDIEVRVGISLVAKWAVGQARHAPLVAGRERNPESVRCGVRQSVDAVGPEVMVLALFAVGYDRRAGRLEQGDRFPNCLLVVRPE